MPSSIFDPFHLFRFRQSVFHSKYRVRHQRLLEPIQWMVTLSCGLQLRILERRYVCLDPCSTLPLAGHIDPEDAGIVQHVRALGKPCRSKRFPACSTDKSDPEILQDTTPESQPHIIPGVSKGHEAARISRNIEIAVDPALDAGLNI